MLRPFLFLPYSSKCLEGEFSEVHIQDPAYSRSYRPLRVSLRASAPQAGGLHVVVLDRYAPWCIAPAQSAQGVPEGFESPQRYYREQDRVSG